MKQVLLIYDHSRRHIPDGIYRHDSMEKEKPVFFPFNADRESREALVPFFTSLVYRGRGLNPRPPSL